MAEPNEKPDEATSSMGAIALSLFLAGILGPLALHVLRDVHHLDENAIVMLCAACEVLALILGIASWRDARGRVAAIGAGLLVVLAAVLFTGFTRVRVERQREALREAEEHRR